MTTSFRDIEADVGDDSDRGREFRYEAFISYSRADGVLVDAIQKGVEQLAKPLFARRTVEIFLDRRSLSPGGPLSQRLTEALDRSRYFILVVSEDSAGSYWVGKENEHWLATRSTEDMILVLARGTLEWPEGADGFTPKSLASLPPTLRDAFEAEPVWSDFSEESKVARDERDASDRLSLDNAEFKLKMAALQGRLRGLEPADIVSEDLELWKRSERRRRRVRIGLIALTITSLIAGIVAVLFARRSADQETEARSRQLASQAIETGADRLDLGLLLGVEAYRIDPSNDSLGSLISGSSRATDVEAMLHLHTRPVRSVAFDPSGGLLASTGLDGIVHLWETTTWQPIGDGLTPSSANGADVELRSLHFHEDGVLVAAADTGIVHVWDVDRAEMAVELEPIDVHDGRPLLAATIDPTGSDVASGGVETDDECAADGTATVVVTALDTRESRSLIHDGANCVHALAYASDGLLAVGLSSGTVALWDTAGVLVGEIDAHDGWVTSLDFSPIDERLVTTGLDNVAVIWDVSDPSSVEEITRFDAHDDVIRSAAFNPDASAVATADRGHEIHLWDPASGATGRPLSATHAAEVRSVAFHPTRPILASASSDQIVAVWRLGGAATIASRVHGGNVSAIEFRADDDVMLTAGSAMLQRRGETTARDGMLWYRLASSEDPIAVQTENTVLALSSRGQILASGETDGTLRVWDLDSGEELARRALGSTIRDLAFVLPTGALAIALDDGSVSLVDDVLDPDSAREVLHEEEDPVLSIDVTADGRWLASAADDGALMLIDLSNGEGQRITVTSEDVRSVAFDPTGAVLAAGGTDGDIALVEVATGSTFGATLTGHEQAVNALSFHPDGDILASGSADDTIRLWNTATQIALSEALRGHSTDVNDLGWVEDGGVLGSVSAGETVLWDLRPSTLRDVACRSANRNLTRNEWANFIGGNYRTTCPGLPAD